MSVFGILKVQTYLNFVQVCPILIPEFGNLPCDNCNFLGYLDFTRNMGFVWAHIWACPPSEGDDYIFHCHPPEQKVPKAKRLQDWYKQMLQKAQERHAIVEFKDIYRQVSFIFNFI